MDKEELENSIRQTVTYGELPTSVRHNLSKREWDKKVLNYSIKNQLRWTSTTKYLYIYIINGTNFNVGSCSL